MNYIQTFIQVAPDSPVDHSVVPVAKGATKPVHLLQYELLSQNPYTYTQEDLLFEVYVRHKGIPEEELQARRAELRAEFFQKEHACLRASMLPKKYGWGLHFDEEGKIALVAMESEEYQKFVEAGGENLKLLTAFRSKRA